VNGFSVFNKQNKRDASYADGCGQFPVPINIDLEKRGLVLELAGQLIENGRKKFAGPAPVGIKIENQQPIAGVMDDIPEMIGIGNGFNQVPVAGGPAFHRRRVAAGRGDSQKQPKKNQDTVNEFAFSNHDLVPIY